jgi:hypothetical protein
VPKLKSGSDLEYIDPKTGAAAKLSDKDIFEINASQSFKAAMQNETGPRKDCPLDITQFSRADFTRYLEDYDQDNPDKYNYQIAKDARKYNKEMEEFNSRLWSPQLMQWLLEEQVVAVEILIPKIHLVQNASSFKRRRCLISTVTLP